MKELRKGGKWTLDFESGGNRSKNIQTELDLIYSLITDYLFEHKKIISIHASTVIHFLNWWLTLPGLFYQDAQKDSDEINRLFLLPDLAIGSVFEDYIDESDILKSATAKEGWVPGETIFKGNYAELSKEQALVTLLVNNYVTKNINLITPKLCTHPNKRFADEWTNKDIVILEEKLSSATNGPLCCVEAVSFDTASEILRAVQSNMYFLPSDIQLRMDKWKLLVKESNSQNLKLPTIVQESKKLTELYNKIKDVINKKGGSLPASQEGLFKLWRSMKKGKGNG
ncbi:MAG: hypothetical protein KAV87_51745 [Desulfobacteraceae bacterium]|nr:hypothetical protein [Desulfobacteraceae bacterium]